MQTPETTRERILKSAFELISSRGYQGATTRDIAKHAGVAEITLFRHFTSKELLFDETARSYSEAAGLRALLPEVIDMPLKEGCLLLLNEYLDCLYEKKEWNQVFYAELQRNFERLQQIGLSLMSELTATCGDYFRAATLRGELKSCKLGIVVQMFIMLCYGCFQVEDVILGRDHRNPDRQDVIVLMVNIFCDGISQRAM